MNIKTLTIPGEVAAAIASARPELLRLGAPRAMSADEVAGMYHVIGQMIGDGFEAQQKVKALEAKLAQLKLLSDEARDQASMALNAMYALRKAFTLPADDDGAE
jgi:hypothetical protein